MENKFSKAQLIESKHFTPNEKDILNALLIDNEYSINDAKDVINKFYDREAK
ncbi:hypothetical protein [Clostridium uliginosum]|uniref:Uncharacterized protein n=1 Tax=Clostridium uliginosum TaxID=119641 RepID=A0A1I1L1E5_9CLOT|nr:hypothetical protein [Clostridium uliginosum]SFC63420.1 hypothetical protein SAMN05421842_106126 [Clostridium uliginosum]